MAKRTGKNCPPVMCDNVFYITVPADSKTIIVVSPKVTTPHIKCEKVAESDGTASQNNRILMAEELMSHVNSDSDDGEDEFVF